MKEWIKRSMSYLSPLKLLGRWAKEDDGPGGEGDKNMQYEDLRDHAFGQFSTAVVRANANLEDRLQVEVGRRSTFIGVYDGHGGAHAAEYVNEHLLGHLTRLAREDGNISEDLISNAFAATENGFRDHVRNGFAPATTGTCCLVGIIWNGRFFIANLGDSRAVTAISSTTGSLTAFPMTDDHNAGVQHIRNELRQLHRGDLRVVFVRKGSWRVKGFLQVTRSIGDFYLKQQEFNVGPGFPKYYLEEPIVKPIIRADPEFHVREIDQDMCRFYIFASDGLWESLRSQEAINMVRENPREGIARRLAVRAMNKAAEKKGLSYSKLVKKSDGGARRQYHDDITVVVIFVDRLQLSGESSLDF